MSTPDLSNDIASNAVTPQSVTLEAGTVVSPNLQGQIEADKYLASKAVLKTNAFPVVFASMQKPGAY